MNIRCTDLEISYKSAGNRETILRRVNLDIGSGEFLAVLGPSGCGKTTFLRTLAGAIQPDGGRIERIPASFGESGPPLLIRQENSLFPWLTALENACFGLTMRGTLREAGRQQALDLFARYGLEGKQGAYPHQLSLGMKQRVALIRAFLCDPPALLMDEPFAALDALSRLRLQQELMTLWDSREHITVVFVTHDVEEALLLSDRVAILGGRPATVETEIAVDLPRPRTAATTLTPEFLRLKARVLNCLGVPVEEAAFV